jgi:hypothetical protein
MTKRSNERRRLLESDIQAYECGQMPRAGELEKAPTLENWETLVRRRGEDFVMIIRGDVHKHPEFRPGENIYDSPVHWLDRRNRFVRTTHTLYALGESAEREIPIDGVDI